MSRKHWILLVKVGVAAALITYLLAHQKIPLEDLGRLSSTWPWFVAALVAYGWILLLAAKRWQILLSTQQLRCPFPRAWSLTLTGLFFNQFMLGSTGGDVAKAIYIASDHPESKPAAILTIFLDRFVGLFLCFCLAGIGALLNLDLVLSEPLLTSLAGFVALVIFGSIAAAALFLSERIRRHQGLRALLGRLPFANLRSDLARAMYVYKEHPRQVLQAMAVALLLHLSVVGMHMLFCLCLMPRLPPVSQLFLLVPLAQAIMAIPISPGSWGLSEAGYHELFFLIGSEEGALISLLQRLTFYAWAGVGCCVYLATRTKYRAEGDPDLPKSEVGEPSKPAPDLAPRATA